MQVQGILQKSPRFSAFREVPDSSVEESTYRKLQATDTADFQFLADLGNGAPGGQKYLLINNPGTNKPIKYSVRNQIDDEGVFSPIADIYQAEGLYKAVNEALPPDNTNTYKTKLLTALDTQIKAFNKEETKRQTTRGTALQDIKGKYKTFYDSVVKLPRQPIETLIQSPQGLRALGKMRKAQRDLVDTVSKL